MKTITSWFVVKQGSWRRLLGSSQNVYEPFQLSVSGTKATFSNSKKHNKGERLEYA